MEMTGEAVSSTMKIFGRSAGEFLTNVVGVLLAGVDPIAMDSLMLTSTCLQLLAIGANWLVQAGTFAAESTAAVLETVAAWRLCRRPGKRRMEQRHDGLIRSVYQTITAGSAAGSPAIDPSGFGDITPDAWRLYRAYLIPGKIGVGGLAISVGESQRYYKSTASYPSIAYADEDFLHDAGYYL